MLDLTKPETYAFLIEEHFEKKKTYTALKKEYGITISVECLRSRLARYRETHEVKIAKRITPVTKEQLEDWVNRKLTISQVYNETGIQHNIIYAACNKYDLRLADGRKRLKNKVTDVNQINELIAQGKDAREIARITGLSYQRTKDYVNAANNKVTAKPCKTKNAFTNTKRNLLATNWNNLCL